MRRTGMRSGGGGSGGGGGGLAALDWQTVTLGTDVEEAADAPVEVALLGDSGLGTLKGAYWGNGDFADGTLFTVPVAARPARPVVFSPGYNSGTLSSGWAMADLLAVGPQSGYPLVLDTDGTVVWTAASTGFATYWGILDGLIYPLS